MKRWIFLLVSVMIFSLTACASAPAATTAPAETTAPEVTTIPMETTVPPETTAPVETTIPAETNDLVFDMRDYDYFRLIFEEKPAEEWESLGRYTVLLKGLHTPVVLDMDGTSVLSISAFGHTVELGNSGLASGYHDGYSPVDYIGSIPDAVVVRMTCGETDEDCILFTPHEAYPFLGESDCDTLFYIREDDTLEYRHIWTEAWVLEQEGFYVLEHLTDRNEILSKIGSARIEDGGLYMKTERIIVLSDELDLDALFAEGKAEGAFEGYETLDDLFAANLARANEE